MNAITPTTGNFSKMGSSIFVNNNSQPLPKLPAATFTVEITPQGQMYFEQIPDLKCTGRLYGDIGHKAQRILTTFEDRPGSTGVLLSGEKGSGKTLLARLLAESCRENHGMPTIMLTKALPGAVLIPFLKEVTQPYVLFIDEFEKIYAGTNPNDTSAQHSLLSMFDGALGGHRLMIATVNETWRVSDYLFNRPGRFFYHLQYGGLDEAFVRDYCAANLANKVDTDGVVAVSMMFEAFNFDMLQALVEEMNRYGEPAKDALAFLNVAPHKEDIDWVVERFEIEEDYKAKVKEAWCENEPRIKVLEGATNVSFEVFMAETGATNPTSEDIDMYVRMQMNSPTSPAPIKDCTPFEMLPEHITKIEGGTITYEAEDEDGDRIGTVVLARKQRRRVSYTSYL